MRYPCRVGFGDEPLDPHNKEEWEIFWNNRLSLQTVLPLAFRWMWALSPSDVMAYRRYYSLFSGRGARRILVAGNGIWTIPYVLNRMGYDVLALDISSTATEYARTHPPDDEMWIRVYGLATADGELYYRTHDPSLAVSILERAATAAPLPGGLSFKQADLFKCEHLQETWDIIIAEHIFDFYGVEDRRILSGRMFEALSQNGLMIVASSQLGEYEDSGIVFESELSAVGFAVHSDRYRSDLSEITQAMDSRVAICRIPTV